MKEFAQYFVSLEADLDENVNRNENLRNLKALTVDVTEMGCHTQGNFEVFQQFPTHRLSIPKHYRKRQLRRSKQ